MAIMSVLNSSGKIIYPYEKGEVYGGGGGSNSGSSEIKGGGGSGVSGGGPVWSDSKQVIWIQVDSGAKYPIQLMPGWNDIHFWIPSIYPDDIWIEAPITIEAPGYLLIPAGFEWDIITSPKAPEKLTNQNMADKLKFVDVYDVEIITPIVPIEVDDQIDDIEFEDVYQIDIDSRQELDIDSLEDITIEDIHSLELELAPIIHNLNDIDDISYEDVNDTELIGLGIIESNHIDSINLEDIDEADNESLSFGDLYDTEIE